MKLPQYHYSFSFQNTPNSRQTPTLEILSQANTNPWNSANLLI